MIHTQIEQNGIRPAPPRRPPTRRGGRGRHEHRGHQQVRVHGVAVVLPGGS